MATARQYFSYLADETHIINLGGLGANTIVLQSTENREDKQLIGYTLFINDYETFTFEDIKDDFKKYGDFLLKTLNKKEKEEQLKKNKIIEKKYKEQKILETKQKSNYDYGLGI